MTQKNPYLIENKKPVETVYELKNEIPSFEEFANSYQYDENIANSYYLENQSQEKGYGPCGDNYDCSCKCKWKSGCSCRFKWDEVGNKGRGDCDMDVRNGSLKGRIGWDGIEVGFEESKSVFRWKDSREEVKCLSGSVGGSARLDLDGVSLEKKLGYDLVNYKNKNGFKARAGFNVDTGGSIGKDGVEAKLGGFGLSVGKKMGVSTPFGGISKDDCVIQ